MKQIMRFCLKVMPMLLLGFVCVFSYPLNVQAGCTLTPEEATAKKNYWSKMGFPQYDPKVEGYKIVLNPKQRHERLEALAQYAEQKGVTPARIEVYRGVDWNRYFNAAERLDQEAERLDISIRQLIDFFNGLEKLFNGNQAGSSIDCSEPPMETEKLPILLKGEKIPDRVDFSFLDIWWEISHVPVLGCVV